jgi:L-lactate dehydrogenase (cytochrome)
MEVLFDGGIRSGQDVLKALALGAKGTFIGRAFLYGLGALGEDGVTLALQIIRKELEVSMAMSGLRDVTEVDERILAHNPYAVREPRRQVMPEPSRLRGL